MGIVLEIIIAQQFQLMLNHITLFNQHKDSAPFKNMFNIRTKNPTSPQKSTRPVTLKKQIFTGENRVEHKFIPTSVGEIGFEKMHKSFKTTKDLQNIKSSNKTHLNEKLEQIKNKCMKNRNSRISIGKETTCSKEEDDEMNQSQDLDNGDQTTNAKAYLYKSKYQNRPNTVHFNYPKCCGIQNPINNRILPLQAKNQLKYKMTGQQYRCIINSLEFNGFQRTDGSEWNVLFDINCTQLKTISHMNKYQKMNHFPGCWTLGRKDYMWKVLNKMKRKFPDSYNFVPATYIFPSDFDRFQMIREGQSKDHLWIMKPSNSACGRGIKMITKDTKIKNKKDYLASQYISNPHLINGLKYDLRIYVFVTSYDPLRIYMFDQGLTRFATHKYSTKIKEIKKRYIHLTNFSVNKHSKNFVKNEQTNEDGKGSKWSLTALKAYYQNVGINTTELFDKIKDIVIKTCIAAQPCMLDIHSKSQQRRTCGFQLYGFDILVDSNLKPWLIQVNVCPSLSSSSPMDRRIKHTLLTDMLNLIGVQFYQRKKFTEEKKKEKQKSLILKNEKKTFSKNINSLEELTFKNCVQILSPEDWLVLFETEEQNERKGHFQRIFPNRSSVDTYLPLFQYQRYNNVMVSKWLKSERNFIDILY